MKLTEFQVKKYRSIMESGEVPVGDRTVFVGRNESGKTNLLRALERVNPAEDIPDFRISKDFPMHLPPGECKDDDVFLTTRWTFDDDDRRHLENAHNEATSLKGVSIECRYGGGTAWAFDSLKKAKLDAASLKDTVKKTKMGVQRLATGNDGARKNMVSAMDDLELKFKNPNTTETWGKAAQEAIANLNASFGPAKLQPSDTLDVHIATLSAVADEVVEWWADWHTLVKEVRAIMPTFVYLDEYPSLRGHQEIPEFLARVHKGTTTSEDREFQRVLKVAGLDASQLHELLDEDHDERRRLLDRAGALVTAKINELWLDNELVVHFTMDGPNFDILVTDKLSGTHVKIPLDDRSRGFRWFFSFYMAFAADTQGGDKDNAILLLDEPGLFLHPRSQRDLINTLDSQFKNQILYTTHSPFMVPARDLSRVRTVMRDKATTVSNDMMGDEQTLFPLQSALGYDLAQNLFVSDQNVVVEGITDYWYLNAASTLFNAADGSGLDEGIVLTPVGGANKVSYMASLLTSQGLDTLVLFDSDVQGLNAAKELIKNKLVPKRNIIMMRDITGDTEAEVEDLLSDQVYEALVKESFEQELAGKTLALNTNIHRVVKRYESAFDEAEVKFSKARPAKLFVKKLADEGMAFLDEESEARLRAVFSAITDRLNGGERANAKVVAS